MITSSSNKILVHASNITGIGAVQVVSSLLKSLNSLLDNAVYVLPEEGGLAEQNIPYKLKGEKICFHRIGGHFISRVMECLFPRLFFPSTDCVLTLGDIPLRGVENQIVLVHQSNLLSPSISTYSSKSTKFKILRLLFRYNLKSVRYIVVQSEVMREQLIASYPILKNKVKSIHNPAPDLFLHTMRNRDFYRSSGSIVRLFYPAAGYPHKNHSLILTLCSWQKEKMPFEFFVTLGADEYKKNYGETNECIQNMGRMSLEKCFNAYQSMNALFFPSLAESYGLPLVEAMKLGIPIICSDLPYARWLCEDQAIYFNPVSAESAWSALEQLRIKLNKGWKPDWSKALLKIPADWDEVAQKYISLLYKVTN